MAVLTCFGEILIDMLPNEGSYLPIAGGAPANVAVGYAKLGGNSRFIGGLGDDVFGEQLRHAIRRYRVDDALLLTVPCSQTALAFVQLDHTGKRRFSFYRHNTADVRFPLTELAHIDWPSDGFFHFCSNTLTDPHSAYTTLAMITMAHHHKQVISFDVNLRQNLWSNVQELADSVERCFHFVDILKFSEEELCYLATAKGLRSEQYLAWLQSSFDVKVLVISAGHKPVTLICDDIWRQYSVPEIHAIDTTASGDSLVAALLFHLTESSLRNELPLRQALDNRQLLKQALKFAVQCGSFTCLSKGAFPAMPEFADVAHHFTPFELSCSALPQG
ncbi:carbohydrate kinase [Pseudoalteromonas fenneropenaei]|uniref:Carbohydrate kinase n=1 Tax=Pseudoalteromonas fenneropenaei TaxID=1737459 RepID=A0ABV7CQB7_9GAMM